MNWFTKLFSKTSSSPKEPALGCVRLPSPWGEEVQRSEHKVAWRDATGDVLSIDRVDGSLGLPGGDDERAIRDACRQIAEGGGGAIVSVDAVLVAGHPATQLIYKKEILPAYRYTAMVFLQFQRVGYVIVIVAGEHGTTGVREAVVTARLFEEGQLTLETYQGGWFRDPYELDYSGPVLRSLSDDEKYDSDFPDHPLSKIRRSLTLLRSDLHIDPRS